MSDINSYNAVTWLLDRKSRKAAATNSPSPTRFPELTYGALQTPSRRLANLLRRLGVHHEQRVAMIMFDTTVPVVFSARCAPASCRSRSTRCSTTDQCAYVLTDPRAGAAVFPSAAAGGQGHRRAISISIMSSSSATIRIAAAAFRRDRRRERRLCAAAPCGTPGVLAVFVGSTGFPRACGICIPTWPRPRTPRQHRCSAFAGRRRAVGGELFRLRPRRCADVSDGQRHHRSIPNADPALMFALMNNTVPLSSSACDAVFLDAERRDAKADARRLAVANLHLPRAKPCRSRWQ